VKTATLWYTPADQPATPEQVQQGLAMLGTTGKMREYNEHPGEPPSCHAVDLKYGFVILDLDEDRPDRTQAEGHDMVIIVEPAPGDEDDEI
jgi:hypothetical protein